ncbi:hypothetical protein TNCV_754201 [Trichonephila clavipes]|nr:hypothetical protein TNCV_754201 [Trichonephila clavipes]
MTSRWRFVLFTDESRFCLQRAGNDTFVLQDDKARIDKVWLGELLSRGCYCAYGLGSILSGFELDLP